MIVVRRALAVLSLAALLVGAGSLSASASSGGAGPVFKPPTPFDITYSFDPGCAGVSIQVDGHKRGVDAIYVLAGSHRQGFLDHQSFTLTETWRNPANGKHFTIHSVGRFVEVGGTFVPKGQVPQRLVPPEGLTGPVYSFLARDAEDATLKDSSGHTLYRFNGVALIRSLFDTLGDRQPGGNQLSSRLVRVSGPHSLLTVDPCDVASAILS